MTGLEMTKLCAEAMGDMCLEHTEEHYLVSAVWGRRYDPLHDDAQAMALVKNFFLRTEWLVTKEWVSLYGGNNAPNEKCVVAANPDLNRAIVECVAKMRASLSTR